MIENMKTEEKDALRSLIKNKNKTDSHQGGSSFIVEEGQLADTSDSESAHGSRARGKQRASSGGGSYGGNESDNSPAAEAGGIFDLLSQYLENETVCSCVLLVRVL